MKECQFVRPVTCQTPYFMEDETETHWIEWICAKAELGLNLRLLLPVSCSSHAQNAASLGWSYRENPRVKATLWFNAWPMTDFGASGSNNPSLNKISWLQITTWWETVRVHHLHRNSWRPKEQLLQNWSPMAQANEIPIVLSCEVPMNQRLWYFDRPIDCPLNKISSNLGQKSNPAQDSCWTVIYLLCIICLESNCEARWDIWLLWFQKAA